MIKNEPDVLGYWWAHENLPIEDADWMLVFVEWDGVYYGKTVFEKEHFSKWIKADFSNQMRLIEML